MSRSAWLRLVSVLVMLGIIVVCETYENRIYIRNRMKKDEESDD